MAALVNAQRLFGNQDLQLIEFAQKGLLELGDETGASLTPKVQDGHDNDLIEVEPGAALPDPLQREFALMGGQTTESSQQPALDALE